MVGRSFDNLSYTRDSDHIEALDSGLDELEATLESVSETLIITNPSANPESGENSYCFI